MTARDETGIGRRLVDARRHLVRVSPRQAHAAVAAGALLIDTRTESQQRIQGLLPGALRIDRTVLEWRLDPGSDYRIPAATSYDQRVVVVCSQGYSSSLAAAELQRIGLPNATDMVDGVEGWLAAGLPVLPYSPDLEAGARPIRPLPALTDPASDAADRGGLLPLSAGNIELVD